jgi:glycosyltransferase involved in cell wall biosynthesis
LRTVQIPRRFVRDAWGGTETVVLETAKRLIARGHQTEVLCPNALADSDHEVMDGVPVRRFPYFYPYWGLGAAARDALDRKGGNLFSFSLLRALARTEGLDLIHLHTGKRLGGIGRTVARLRGIPYVVSLHGGVHDVPAAEAATWTAPTAGTIEWGRVLGSLVGSRKVLSEASAIICLSEAERRTIQARHPHARVELIPNGVDVARFSTGNGQAFRRAHGVPERARLLLLVGRVDPQKNQALALSLVGALAQRHPDVHLVLAGPTTSPAYAASLEHAIRARGLQPRVTWLSSLGHASQALVDAYHAADVCLLPSRHEPFGIVALEAWAAGKPVVASRVGGIPGFVESGVNGVLVDPDDERGWLEAIDTLLDSPVRAAALGENGRQRGRAEFDWDRVTDRLVGLYEDVAAVHARPRAAASAWTGATQAAPSRALEPRS